MFLNKIISGGQTGVDQAALVVAKKFGIPTGGTAPAGYLTSSGPMPNLGKEYGLRAKGTYKSRTLENVKNSGGTLLLAVDWWSPGTVCTKDATVRYNKPCLEVRLDSPLPAYVVVSWITENDIRILNVAGNRQTVRFDVFSMTVDFLTSVILELGKEEKKSGPPN